jgi:diguanylate cyclase (GGDEF)-like protein
MVNPDIPNIGQFLTGDIEHDLKCLSTILDSLNALIYVSDIDTHELLYLNQYGQSEWVIRTHGKCFHMQDEAAAELCDFCANQKLINQNNQSTGIHHSEFQNPTTGKWYQAQAQAIKWHDGHLVRLEIAFDITEQKQLEHQLRTAHAKAKSSANTDPLLNCLNRRAFFERFDSVLAHCQRHKYPLTLVMMDIDNFKVFNDRFGHSFGDQLLLTTTNVFEKAIRESDIFARYGGDEFILALPNTSQENAIELLSRIQQDMSKLAASPSSDFSVTISFGLTSLDEKSTVDKLLNQADIALYQAKNAGRNRIEVYQTPGNH